MSQNIITASVAASAFHETVAELNSHAISVNSTEIHTPVGDDQGSISESSYAGSDEGTVSERGIDEAFGITDQPETHGGGAGDARLPNAVIQDSRTESTPDTETPQTTRAVQEQSLDGVSVVGAADELAQADSADRPTVQSTTENQNSTHQESGSLPTTEYITIRQHESMVDFLREVPGPSTSTAQSAEPYQIDGSRSPRRHTYTPLASGEDETTEGGVQSISFLNLDDDTPTRPPAESIPPRETFFEDASDSPMLQPERQRPRRATGDIVLPRWQPDAEVTYCPICSTQFSFFVRKHHCR
jgi:hypothetical protein